jgi:hypothetical protein
LPYPEIGAASAPAQPIAPTARALPQRRVQGTFMAVLLAVALVPAQAPAPVEASHTEASRIIAHATDHVTDPFRWGV